MNDLKIHSRKANPFSRPRGGVPPDSRGPEKPLDTPRDVSTIYLIEKKMESPRTRQIEFLDLVNGSMEPYDSSPTLQGTRIAMAAVGAPEADQVTSQSKRIVVEQNASPTTYAEVITSLLEHKAQGADVDVISFAAPDPVDAGGDTTLEEAIKQAVEASVTMIVGVASPGF